MVEIGCPRMILLRLVAYALMIFFNVIYAWKVAFRLMWRPLSYPWKPKYRSRPACLQDPKYGNHKYLIVNGVKIHYVVKGDHKKPLMLFVHGFPEFWYSWRHQIVEFSKDYWCVAMDLRGFGDSDKPQCLDEYLVPKITEDIKAVVEALGRERFILVSHDWGSVISWGFRDKYPEKLLAFVAMDAPSGSVFQKLLTNDLSQLVKSWYMFFFQAPILPELAIQYDDFEVFHRNIKTKDKEGNVIVTEEDFEAFKYMFSQPGVLTGGLNYYRANLLGPPATEKSGLCDVPSLYLHGEEDKYVGLTAIEQLKTAYPDLKTVLIRNQGHFVQQEAPVAVNAELKEFFESLNLSP